MADLRPLTGLNHTYVNDAMNAQLNAWATATGYTGTERGIAREPLFWHTYATGAPTVRPYGDARLAAMNQVAGKTFTGNRADIEKQFWNGN
jgi:hypothetical protein